MGIKNIFQDGMKEFKRRSSLHKEKRDLQQKEKLLAQQLTALGKKAWESRIDITAHGNLNELLTGAQKQQEELNSLLQDLEKQKLETEEKRKQSNDSFDSQRKAVEEKKKEVDTRLEEQEKILKQAQRESKDATNRLSHIAREEGQLKGKIADPQTPEEEKTGINDKLGAFVNEREELEQKIKNAGDTARLTEEKIVPIKEESGKLQKESDDIRARQKEVIGALDNVLSEAKEKISENQDKLNEVNQQQDENFGQLGEKLAAAEVSDALSAEFTAVKTTEKEIGVVKSEIERLDNSGTPGSRGALWKMIGLILAIIIVIVAIIIGLSLLLGSGSKAKPGASQSKAGQVLPGVPGSEALPPQVAATLQKYKEAVSGPAGQGGKQEGPKTMGEAMADMNAATGEIKKYSQQLQGKEIVVSDQAALTAVLPELSGWAREKPTYHKGSFGQLETSMLRVTYNGPDSKQVDISITDAASVSALLQSWKLIFQMNLTHDDSDSYQKITTVNDIPVIERFDKQSKRARFSFLVKDRYVVELESEGEGSLDLLKQFIPKLDLSKLQ
jgi:hypothetical protein